MLCTYFEPHIFQNLMIQCICTCATVHVYFLYFHHYAVYNTKHLYLMDLIVSVCNTTTGRAYYVQIKTSVPILIWVNLSVPHHNYEVNSEICLACLFAWSLYSWKLSKCKPTLHLTITCNGSIPFSANHKLLTTTYE